MKRILRWLVGSPWGAAAFVFVVAFAVRFAFAIGYVGVDRILHAPVEAISTDQPEVEDIVDADGYTVLGREMISGRPYRDTTRQPLFPAFQALVFLTCGSHPTLLYNRLAGALVAALGCSAIYLLGRAMFGRAVGLVAGLLAAVHINLIHKSGYILSENIAVPLLTVALYFFVRFADERRWRRLIAGGLLFWLATLARPTTYPMIYLLPLWLWMLYGKMSRQMLIRSVVLVALVIALLVPWGVHTYAVSGRFVLASARPWSLLCGCYCPAQFAQPLGNNKGHWIPIAESGLFTEAELAEFDLLPSWEVDARCRGRFLEYLPDVLPRVPELMAYRALTFLGLYKSPGRSGAFYLAYHGEQVVLFVLFLAGVWVSRRQWRRFSILHLAYLFLGVFMILAFYGGSRTRLYVEPLIIVFAAYYGVSLVRRCTKRGGQEASAA